MKGIIGLSRLAEGIVALLTVMFVGPTAHGDEVTATPDRIVVSNNYGDWGHVYNEGETVGLSIGISVENINPLYAFVEPLNADATNALVSSRNKQVLGEGVTYATGVEIPAGTKGPVPLNLMLQDGPGTILFRVVLCETRAYDATKLDNSYASDNCTIICANVAPQAAPGSKAMRVGGYTVTNNAALPYAIPADNAVALRFTFTDVAADRRLSVQPNESLLEWIGGNVIPDEFTNGLLIAKWSFYNPNGMLADTRITVGSAKSGLDSGVVSTNFTFTAIGDNEVAVQLLDKDMIKALLDGGTKREDIVKWIGASYADPDGYWKTELDDGWGPEFRVIVPVAERPDVSIEPVNASVSDYGEYGFSEGATAGGFDIVLSEPATAPLTVKLWAERTARVNGVANNVWTRGSLELMEKELGMDTNEYVEVTFRRGTDMQRVSITGMDGTPYSSYRLHAVVITTTTDENNIPMDKLYREGVCYFSVFNRDPKLNSMASNVGISFNQLTGLASTNVVTVMQNQDVGIAWTVADFIRMDETNNFTVTWSSSEPGSTEITNNVVSGKYTTKFTSAGDKTITLSINDKDGGANFYEWHFYVIGQWLPAFTIENGVLMGVELNGTTEVVIPDSVTSIGDWAFDACSGLTSVVIPNSVTNIGKGAFADCDDLTAVTMPNGVTIISDSLFIGCHSLVDVSIPEGVTRIGHSAFRGCPIESVIIPDGVRDIGEGAFWSCALTSVTIPDSVTSIGGYAFDGCSGLTNVIFNGNAPSIGDDAFASVYSDCIVYVHGGSTGWGVEIPGIWNGLRIEYLADEIAPVAWPGEGKLPEDCSAYDDGTYTWVWRQETGGGAVLTGYYSDFTDPVYGFQVFRDFCGVYPNPIGEVPVPSFIPAGTVGRVWTGSEYVYKAMSEDVPVVGMGDGLFLDCFEMTRVAIPACVTNVHAWAFDYCAGLVGVDVADGNSYYKSENGFLLTRDGKKLVQGINGDGVIPNGVTVIGDSAYYGCFELESVTVPSGVTLIEEDAFAECSSLTDITIPDSVTNIERYAFYACSNLTEVLLPQCVTSVGDGVFCNCTGLTSVTIPDSVTSIGDVAFENCSGLTSVTIPDSVTSIGDGAFAWCENLTSVTIPDSVTSIGSETFCYCSGLTSVTIPNSVTSIEGWAFSGCSGLTNLIFEGDAPSIGQSAFDRMGEDCVVRVHRGSTGWGVEIPGTWNGMRIEYLADEVAPVAWPGEGKLPEDCSAYDDGTYTWVWRQEEGGGAVLTGYYSDFTDPVYGFQVFRDFCGVYPDPIGVVSIPSFIPAGTVGRVWTGSEYVNKALPEDIPVVGMDDGLFLDCSEMTRVVIPAGVTNVHAWAFDGCGGLIGVDVADGSPCYKSENGFLLTKEGERLVQGINGDVVVPNGVTVIGDSAFYGCFGLESVTIPDSVTLIEEYAFGECSSLTDITIPGSVTRIGEDAFMQCSELESVTISDGVMSIGEGAFHGCSGLTRVTIPASVTSIGDGAFSGCWGLADEDGFVVVRNVLYGYDGNVSDVTIPDSVTSIGEGVFAGCYALTSIIIPNSVVSIGEHAFDYCIGLTNLVFEGDAPYIGEYAFVSTGADCVVRVRSSSTGWGVEIPGTWNGMRIEYLEADGPDLIISDVVVEPTSFLPGDTVIVQYIADNYGVMEAHGNWHDRIALEDAWGRRVVLATVAEIGPLPYSPLDLATGWRAVGGFHTTARCTIPDLVSLAGEVRFVVVADVNNDIEEMDETNNEGRSDVVSLGKRLYLTAASESIKENVSSGVRFTLRRSGPVNEALTVAVGNTDTTSASAPATVTIPAGSVSTIFTVAPIDNAIVDGMRVVRVSVSADGFTGAFVPLTILDDEVPRLTVTLNTTSIREGDGVITATVTREGSTEGDLTVYLSGTSGSRASYPSSVVIPSGAASATFEISVPNNDTAQVASELTLRASSSGYQSTAVTYTVEDDDVPGVVLTIAPEAVQEGAGASAAVMTLARADTEDMSKAITVRLTASIANVLIMPKEVVIPANNPYVRQEIGIVDNANVELNRDITITGAIVIPSCNCSAQPSSGGEIQTMLRIIDDDSLALKLRVEPLMMKEGQEVAGYITVGQNTVLAENLVVSLYSDNDAEVELPPTVVIPAGETSVRVPVKTLNDGVEDGTVQVNIYAEADGYAPDSKWVFVTDQNLPDLTPIGIEPKYATATAGERISVSFAVTNIGYLTSKRSVPFSIYCVKGKSATIEDAGMLVFSGMTDGAVDIGASAVVSAIVTVPDITGDCRFAVVVDPDRLITELNDANNTAYSSVVSVSPSYMAEVQVDGERFLQGSTIEINGVAVKADGTTPAANVEVEVYIIRDAFRRQLMATTDAQGRFVATFKPTSSEAGHYVIGASFPGMNATAEQDAFDILGMKRTSDAYLEFNNIPLGDEMSKTVYIRNMSPIDLTGISAEVVGVLSGCEIETSFADVLSGGATIPLTLTLRGTDLTSGRDYKEFTLRLASSEGVTLDIPVLYFVQYQQAHIKATPASINTTMTIGQTRYVDFTIYNDGRGDSGKVTILASPFPWLSIEGGNEIANLASNESAIVTLKLTPGDDVELNNRYTGEIAVNCESGHGKGCVVPFAFKAVSEHTGWLKVDVVDGYTYYLDSAPHVSNATVRISNTYTGEIVASGTTGVDGTWTSGEIGEGKWQLAIVANGHKPYYDEVTVSPGIETALPPIYLEAQTVTMSYSVTPTNIVDTYIVTLVTEYETSVPEPVLVTTFDGRIPDLQEGGEPFAFNAIVVNKGLVSVHGVYLEMPTIDGWEFTVGDSGFSLAPEESAIVPIIVRRPRKRTALMAAAAAVTVTKVDCVDVVRTRGYWYCGGDRRWHEYKVQLPTERVCTTTTYTIVPTEEESKPPTKPGRIGGGGGTYTPGGGGSGTSRITISKTDCDPCANILQEMDAQLYDLAVKSGNANRDLWLSITDIVPFGGCINLVGNAATSIPGISTVVNAIQNNQWTREITGDYFRSYFKRGDLIKGFFEFIKDGATCLADTVLKPFKWAGVAIKGLATLCDYVNFVDSQIVNAREGVDVMRRVNAEYSECLSKYQDTIRDFTVAAGALEDWEDILRNILGDDLSNYPAEDAIHFLMSVLTVIGDDWFIDAEKRETIKALVGNTILGSSVDDWAQRWNNGISKVLEGDDGNTSEFDVISIFLQIGEIIIADDYARGRGYASVQEMFENTYNILLNVYKEESGNVCAKVTLELSQEVTMTREAFLGTLSVSNGHTSKPITDMKMEIEITDENGERCDETLFQPENAGLVTMQGTSILDGGVSLAANSSGSANILFTPSTKAAHTVPKVYYFGGTVTYTDPFVGETVRVKLQPAVPVTVHPSPELTFHYFLQRDVIGDDPFTKDVVEESEPAEVALLILNKGYGDAENVTIKTAEPTIIENEKELKVDFNWVDAALDGASTRLGYRNVDIGTVPAQGSRLAQWWLTSSLQGHFTKVDGSYTRLNSNGNPDFDLIKHVITHTLVRSITADNDALPDFLVTEGRFDGIPNFIYMDNGDIIDVSEATDATISGTGANVMLTVVPGATGWNYASCRHSLGSGLSISRVTRGDGSEVPLRNVWLTNRTFEDGVDPIVEDRIHIADEMAYGVVSVYTIEFGGAAGAVDRPQVVGFFGVADLMGGNPAAIEIQFSCDIDATTFDVADLTLHHQGTAVADLSGLSISASGESGRFTISGFGNLGLGSGTYVLTVQASGVKDLSGISGTGSKSVMWTVVGDNTPPAQITDLAISPDGGFSDTDGITYTGALTVSGTLPEAGLTVEIIAKYVGGGETVLATMPSAGGDSLPAGAFSQDINLSGAGNVTLVVRLTDAAGNSSDTEKNVFVDGIALTGTLTGASEDEGVVTSSATLAFSDRVMEGDVALEKFSLTRNGEAVALEGVALTKVNDTTFLLAGLESLCSEDGVYVLRFDGAAVRKHTSGLMMGASLVMRWRYENPDREPPTVTEVLFDGEVPHEAYTNVFSTVSVTFSEAVNVPELIENGLVGKAARIDLLDAAGIVTGCVAAARSASTPYQWDADGNTLSWQIDPLDVPAGRARLILDAGLITDMAGNRVSAEGYAATNGMRTYMLSEAVLAQVNAQAMPTWYNGELYVGEKTADNKGKIRHYAANGTWEYLQSDGVDIEVSAQGCQGASVAFADMDGDGVTETYIGTTGGNVLKYPGGETVASLGVSRAMPYAYDIDGDGCDELITGGMDGRIRLISRDMDSGTYSVALISDVNGAPITVPNGRAAPVVADINHDGLVDILSGDTAGNVWAYLGVGAAWFAQPVTVFANDAGFADRSRLGYGDVDGDGIEDLVVGRSDGSVTVMRGAETPSPCVEFTIVPLSVGMAVNADELDWLTDGACEWKGTWSRDASDGLHEARCGVIPNGTNAWLSTVVEGPGTISFKWRSALASRNTKYQLMVDGEVKGMLAGDNDWTEASVSVFGNGAHEIKWRLMTGRSGASDNDWVALDEVAWTPTVPPTLAEALNVNLDWTTDGDVAWHGVARESLTDSRDAWAVVSGLGDEGTSWVQTRVYGSGIMLFDWAISCEEDYDWMELSVDGKVCDYISGAVGWTSSAVEIVGDGWHVVRWEFVKDEMDDPALVGDNIAKLDNVVWVSEDVEPTDPIPAVAVDANAATVNAEVDGVGFADVAVKAVIGGSAEEYNAFKTWAGGVKGATGDTLAGEAAVVANEHAAAAYLLGAERLLENEPTVEFDELAVAEGESAGTTAMTVAVTVKDGESAVAVDAEKVAAMFEATGDLGDWTGAARLTPKVTTTGADASGKMTFVVTPGDGTADRAFLRIKR